MLTTKVIGTRIKKTRESKGWTQSQLAQKIGVNQSEISKIEAGLRDIGIIQLDNITRALNVPLIGFITDKATSIHR